MTWGPTEVQKKIYEIFTGDATLMSKVSGIFDHTLHEQEFPFVTIGQANFTDRGSYTTEGWLGEITINTWSRAYGRLETQQIMADIDRLLHCQDLGMDGWSTLNLRRAFNEILVDEDSVTYHGVQRYTLYMGDINNE